MGWLISRKLISLWKIKWNRGTYEWTNESSRECIIKSLRYCIIRSIRDRIRGLKREWIRGIREEFIGLKWRRIIIWNIWGEGLEHLLNYYSRNLRNSRRINLTSWSCDLGSLNL